MPLEALVCTKCGSADVQEVKFDTYFCNYCDTVFKYIDPARLGHGPAFCAHGNPIEVQCQFCKAGMCREGCDAALFRHYDNLVRTVGFGYVEERHAGRWVEGPFLSIGELLTSLALTYGSLGHVCYACVADAVPAMAEQIDSGAICAAIRCDQISDGRCPCCRGAFCKECLEPAGRERWRERGFIMLKGRSSYDQMAVVPQIRARDSRGLDITFRGAPYDLDWSLPDGMCAPCVAEKRRDAAAAVKKICEQEYASLLLAPAGDYYLVPPPPYKPFKGRAKMAAITRYDEERKLEHEQTMKAARRYAAEIGARLQKLVVVDGNCGRSRSPAGDPDEFSRYRILDERERVKPAVASRATWILRPWS